LREMEKFQPKMLMACASALEKSKTDLDFIRLDKQAFEECRSLSIDYAIMERTENAAVIHVDMGWSDLGSWHTLGDMLSSDQAGNVTSGNVTVQDCKDTLVFSDSRLVVTVGLDDMLVIDTPDALLVADKNRSQQIRQVVENLKS